MRRAIFPGSFDPFTIGHYDIVKRGLQIFDEVIIGIGENIDKQGWLDANKRAEAIKQVFANEPRVRVMTYSGLTTDFAQRVKADFILRGVRNGTDLEYEKTLADINRKLSGVETVILTALPEHAMISSSMVRELHHYGIDISEYLPQGYKI